LPAGARLASLLAYKGNNVLEALFTQGGFANSAEAMTAPMEKLKSVLRKDSIVSQKDAVGPVHTVTVRHGTDGRPIVLQLQAVKKQSSGGLPGALGGPVYVRLHVAKPTLGRPDFATWLQSSPLPSFPSPIMPNNADGASHPLAGAAASHRKVSQSFLHGLAPEKSGPGLGLGSLGSLRRAGTTSSFVKKATFALPDVPEGSEKSSTTSVKQQAAKARVRVCAPALC
jgi:hypothetical protein